MEEDVHGAMIVQMPGEKTKTCIAHVVNADSRGCSGHVQSHHAVFILYLDFSIAYNELLFFIFELHA